MVNLSLRGRPKGDRSNLFFMISKDRLLRFARNDAFAGFVLIFSIYPIHALTPNEALQIARDNNPSLVAARKKVEAVRARAAQEAYPMKPRLDFERMYASKNKDVISDAEERNIVISQEIPFPTTLYLNGKAARLEVREAQAAYEARENAVLKDVKESCAKLALTQHHIVVFKENTELMKRFANVAESKYAVGKVPQSDVLKAQVELSKMMNMLVTLEQEKKLNMAALNTLLNRDPDASIQIEHTSAVFLINPSIVALESTALKNRPELREMKTAVKTARARTAAARSDYLPDLMMQYRKRDMKEGRDSHDAMLGLTLPFWLGRQNGTLRETRAEWDMAEADLQTMENMTRYEVREALVNLETTHRLVQLYETSVLPQARQALKVTEASYKTDRMNFLDILDAARTLLEFELEYYEYLTDYDINKAELERIVGETL